MLARYAFEFSEHLDSKTATTLVNNMQNIGTVVNTGPGRTYEVQVFRASRVERARISLANYEISGFLTWRRLD